MENEAFNLSYTGEQVEQAISAVLNGGGGGGCPVGSIFWHAATEPPEGFLVCDGSILLVAYYPDLYAVIGDTWTPEDAEEGTFALPNLQAAFIRGAGSQGGYSATFGQKQEATNIYSTRVKRELAFSEGNTYIYRQSLMAESIDRSRSIEHSFVSSYRMFDVTAYNKPNVNGWEPIYYIRPYNIALTPIIKY